MILKRIGQLVGCITLSLAAGIIGSAVMRTAIDSWYANLDKPPLLPPDGVFGLVWTILYILVGTALFLVVIAKANTKRRAYRLFGVQLVLNTAWSLIFFGARQPWLALVVILLLLASLVAVYKEFLLIRKVAAVVFVPYIAWVGFATYLNTGVALLN
jgi:translocator protein